MLVENDKATAGTRAAVAQLARAPWWPKLVAKVIGEHGGTVDCETQARRTVFRVMLAAAEEAGAGEGQGAEGVGRPGYEILVDKGGCRFRVEFARFGCFLQPASKGSLIVS